MLRTMVISVLVIFKHDGAQKKMHSPFSQILIVSNGCEVFATSFSLP